MMNEQTEKLMGPYTAQIASQDKSWIYAIRTVCADGTAIYQNTKKPLGAKGANFIRFNFDAENNSFKVVESFEEIPSIQDGDHQIMTTEILDDGTFRITY